jgi:hypothetical protein
MLQVLRRAYRGPGGAGCSGDDDLERGDEERHREELVKLSFEMCKHLTTLSAAATLIVLAIYRELTFGSTLLGVTLSLFGLTIVVSTGTMVASMSYFTNIGRRDRAAADPLFMWPSAAAIYIFIIGVAAFMLFLLDLPGWVLIFVVLALLLLGRSVTAYFHRRSVTPTSGPDASAV